MEGSSSTRIQIESSKVLSPYQYLQFYNKTMSKSTEDQSTSIGNFLKDDDHMHNYSKNTTYNESTITHVILPKSRANELNIIPIPPYMKKEHDLMEELMRKTIKSNKTQDEETLRLQKKTDDLANEIAKNNKKQDNVIFRAHAPAPRLIINDPITFIDNTQKKYFSLTKQYMLEINKHKQLAQSQQSSVLSRKSLEYKQVEMGSVERSQEVPKLLKVNSRYESPCFLSRQESNSHPLSPAKQRKDAEERYQNKMNEINKNRDPTLQMSKAVLDRKNISLRRILTSIPELKLRKMYEDKKAHIEQLIQLRKSQNNQFFPSKHQIKPKIKNNYLLERSQFLKKTSNQTVRTSPECSDLREIIPMKFKKVSEKQLVGSLEQIQVHHTGLISNQSPKHQRSSFEDRIIEQQKQQKKLEPQNQTNFFQQSTFLNLTDAERNKPSCQSEHSGNYYITSRKLNRKESNDEIKQTQQKQLDIQSHSNNIPLRAQNQVELQVIMNKQKQLSLKNHIQISQFFSHPICNSKSSCSPSSPININTRTHSMISQESQSQHYPQVSPRSPPPPLLGNISQSSSNFSHPQQQSPSQLDTHSSSESLQTIRPKQHSYQGKRNSKASNFCKDYFSSVKSKTINCTSKNNLAEKQTFLSKHSKDQRLSCENYTENEMNKNDIYLVKDALSRVFEEKSIGSLPVFSRVPSTQGQQGDQKKKKKKKIFKTESNDNNEQSQLFLMDYNKYAYQRQSINNSVASKRQSTKLGMSNEALIAAESFQAQLAGFIKEI